MMSTDVVCIKRQASSPEDDQREILHAVSREWVNEVTGAQRASRKKFLSSSGDILKRSIFRRSWTINGPPARWCGIRGSPEWRAYQSLPATARYQNYFHDTSDLVVPTCPPKPKEKNGAISTELDVPVSNEEDGIKNDDSDDENVKQSSPNGKLDNSVEVDHPTSKVETDQVKRPSEDIATPKRTDQLPPRENIRIKFDNPTSPSPENTSSQEQSTPRVSLIKPPRIHTKFSFPDIKQSTKSSERKSNIPIFRRSSKEFEDIRSPQESAKRSLIPQRYKGSTDDLRRSREDINVPSLIPKLLSPRYKEDKLKRPDSRDEIRYGPKGNRKDNKEPKEDFKLSCSTREDTKIGIKFLRRNSKEDVNKDSTSKIKTVNKEERHDKVDECTEELKLKTCVSEQVIKTGKRTLGKDNKEGNDGTIGENKMKNLSGNSRENEKAATEEMMKKKKVAIAIKATNELMKREKKLDGFKWDKCRSDTTNAADDGMHDDEIDETTSATDEKEARFETSYKNQLDDFQVVRRKFSKEEFSNPDDTDDMPNRRSSSHLSPEASPLSTRSSRYSPRESESEPTPALPRKAGDSCAASQRVREAITRTRRESNSSARYESSGSESIRLSDPGVHGCFETRRVRFGGSGSGAGVGGGGGGGNGGGSANGAGAGIDGTIQRDSATSAGEDEPLHNTLGRDPRVALGAQGRTVVRRRRQFDAQGSRRRGRTHGLRGCGDDLQTLQVIGRSGGQSSPPGPQSQGPEPSITEYRRLVFISSDSSSGREEDDADSSSGSSSSNGVSRCSIAQGLDDCDWDYFESGSIPPSHPANAGATAAATATTSTTHSGISLPTQHWSCCPGRGSSACQACGGARAANVLPVPVPIPVPVPYPVPVPAALWTNDFTNSSMINCSTGAEGALRLRGGPAASMHPAVPWFAWPPRFTHAVHGVRTDRLNLNLKANADVFDPSTFAFHAGVTFDRSSGIDFGKPIPKASTNTEPSGSNNRPHLNTPNSSTNANETTTYAPNVESCEFLFHVNDPSAPDITPVVAAAKFNIDPNAEKLALADVVAVRKKGVSNKNSDTESLTEDERSSTKPLHSSKCRSKAPNMYRLSQGNSGSSSGRSSADSSDLEDSASHHFSRVFVVNDDSLTSDNDIEGNEDSDSARESGITLRRVTALPEDGPVILRHVKLLDEDISLVKPLEISESSDSENEFQGVVNMKHAKNVSADSVRVADGSRCDLTFKSTGRDQKVHPKDKNKFKSLRSFDPVVNEIYLVDSKDDPDEQIELKSVKSFDPDVIDTDRDLPPLIEDRKYLQNENQLDRSNKIAYQFDHSSDMTYIKNQITQSELCTILSGDSENIERQSSDLTETKEFDVATHPAVSMMSEPVDSLMPERTDSVATIVPDSLEVSDSIKISRNDSECFCGESMYTESNSNKIQEIPTPSDIYSSENKFNQPAINIDKPVTRVDKPAALSAVHDEPLATEGFEPSKMSANINAGLISSLNSTNESDVSTGTTESSETNTGSEVSSDELHEYEVRLPEWTPRDEEHDEVPFSAINKELIQTQKLKRDGTIVADLENIVEETNGNSNDKTESQEESETPNVLDKFATEIRATEANKKAESTVTRNHTTGGFPCEGAGLSLDSGVVAGMDDTNAMIIIKRGVVEIPSEHPKAKSILVLASEAQTDAAVVRHDAAEVIDSNNGFFKSGGDVIAGGDKIQSSADINDKNKLIPTAVNSDPTKHVTDNKIEAVNELENSHENNISDTRSVNLNTTYALNVTTGNDQSDNKIDDFSESRSYPSVLDNDDSGILSSHSVDDIISSKIHEIFKSVESNKNENKRSPREERITVDHETSSVKETASAALSAHDEGGIVRSERSELKQVEGGKGSGETERGTRLRSQSVQRRPPNGKDGFPFGFVNDPLKNSENFPANKYKSLVMITQGTYQPVSVVTSDTTTLLQPEEESSPPHGLAGYFQLALEAVSEPHHINGASPRRPLMVKRSAQAQIIAAEPEVDSGLSVGGSASESDDVLSVKSASKVNHSVSNLDQTEISGSSGSSYSNDSPVRGRGDYLQAAPSATSPADVLILEEGLADDDSWVEEVSHDEDEQGATTATEESSEDEANNLGDREEELRGYHRQAIDFTLHTIVEESCEESEAEPNLAANSPRKQRPPSASELEKYFFFGLGDGSVNNINSREIDSLSETSSIYSEGLESLGQEETVPGGDKNSGDFLNSSRLEKYFLSEFLGFNQDRRDSDGSVGSDSEGRPSPEQRRKRLVRARGTGRSHSSSLDNLLALAQSSQNLSSQNSLQDLSLNPDSQETQSEGSSTETDGAEDQTPVFGTDGQFDTVKRKKKKPRNLGTQSPRIPEDRNKTPEPPVIETDGELEVINSEDDRAKTPQPESIPSQSDSSRGKQSQSDVHSSRIKQQADSERSHQVNELITLNRTKQQSRDSGFIGSCDDLLQHQKMSHEGQISNGNIGSGKDSSHDREVDDKNEEVVLKIEVPFAQSSSLAPPNASLSRKDSFNNWSSDEETNLMMSKMRQFFKTMVGNSNNNQNSNNNSSGASPAPSPRLSRSSPKSRLGNQNRMKPPQLVYFENELTRLMKTVPGIRDEQVREIVEYLSSEDTWSDSYDSSDYTSSDLEGAGGRRSALQEQISQSCQQIISKFDTTASDVLSEKESTAQSAQPLNRDTAVVYQKLVQSFTKMAGDGVSSDASSTPHSSPPLIAKVMHHIGSRLVALMHEVSEGGPAVQQPSWRRYPHHRTPSSASTTEDDDSTSDSTNTPTVQQPLPRSKSHDPLLLLNSHHAAGCQEGEEREASDYERFSWRGSFESALMAADSRTKLSLLAYSGDVSASASALAIAAKRRSAGDLLFNPKSLSREQLDRVRSCGSIGGGSGSIEDKIWSNRRRSSVPDASTRGESGASAGDEDTEDELEYSGDSRATTLPRGLQAAAAAATNSLPRLPASVPTSQGMSMMMMHKAHSVHHFLQQHNNVKSARYRPPGFARNNLNCSGSGVGGPKRAVSAPGLQLPASSSSGGKRDASRTRRQQAISLTHDDGSSLSEACSTPIIGGGMRDGTHATDDDMDHALLPNSHLGTRASLSSLGARSESMASVYSGAGEGRWCGSVAVRGEVKFALLYEYKDQTFAVRVTQCRDLAPVDVKRNRSDPYVKVYLLPDKSKSGKRKTKVKKHTLNPVFDETLRFKMSLNGLETRTLWLTVWHSDMFGRNDFLGEVRVGLENKIFDDPTPRWYPLQERTELFDDPVAYKGEVIVGLKFVPPDPSQLQQEGGRDTTGEQRDTTKTRTRARKSWSRGSLHVLVKEARNLQTRAKHSGTCDPFCKSYLLPDKGRSGKQKTGVVRKCSGGSPVWGHTFIYKDVSLQELAERGLELTVWDHDLIASNEFLGGVRFNLGTGKHYGKPVEWMDATGRELSLWQSMLERPNFWVEGSVTLRPNLHNHNRNNAN